LVSRPGAISSPSDAKTCYPAISTMASSTITTTTSTVLRTVLIITGAWHLPEHYSGLTFALMTRGIRVICPRLPSNNNAHPPNKFLADDVAFIRSIVAEELERGTHLTVVGNSWGGIVMTAALGDFGLPTEGETAAETLKLPPNERPVEVRKPGGVVKLIYLTAFVPFEHESLAGIFGERGLPPWLQYHPQDDTLRPADPTAVFHQDLKPEMAQLALDMMVWHSGKAQNTPIETVWRTDDAKPRKAAWRTIPTSYLYCEGDAAIPLFVQEMMVGRMKGEGITVDEYKVTGDHLAALSMPGDVADGIVKLMAS
jgi:pimeloyl-ACP methyl ester carboxylesterase